MAVTRGAKSAERSDQGGPPSRTPVAVPLTVNVTDEYPGGVQGMLAQCRSLLAGLTVTARRALRPGSTLRYPRERVTLSPRWRGPLRLRGVLGVETISLVDGGPLGHNERVDALYRDDRLPPCIGNCPASVDARGQGYLIAEGRSADAYELVRERNILPGVLGRICHHPCEAACRRNYYDEPIAIRPLHRHAYEEYAKVATGRMKPFARTRSARVAVIGSGPSGLAAAYDLMTLGYGVTVYEKEERPGGALYTGVPAYRLPREVLFDEIENLVSLGMELKLGIEVGVDVPIDYLAGEYDAVLIAVGLQESKVLPIPGHSATGVIGALAFLRDVNLRGDAGVAGKRVLVIGGGNVAVDVARCAVRTGAREVRLACLEAVEEMPCHPWEIEEALDEGVITMCSLGPEEVLVADGGTVRGMRMRECLSVFDEAGRFAPQFGDEYTDIAVDVIVFAVGQAPLLADVIAGSDLSLTDRGLLPVDGRLFTTEQPGVFSCGEVVTGPGSAIGSIATGHEAAVSIHRYLEGADLSEARVQRPVPVYDRYESASVEGVETARRRAVMPMARPEARAEDFRPIELGLTSLESLWEAARCLRCQSEVCVGCTFCARVCPCYAIEVERTDDPGERRVTHYQLDISKCCYCGLCAEQCPTDALAHTGEYELSFYHRDAVRFDRHQMRREGSGTRATGHDTAAVATDTAPSGSERVP
ncbi:MAG TPA: FAD-dependent oxidoreductase [Coriobacteriia bacterium]|nr:FAD-dependent oxidoreductase [Coriobacteriia bacterium]